MAERLHRWPSSLLLAVAPRPTPCLSLLYARCSSCRRLRCTPCLSLLCARCSGCRRLRCTSCLLLLCAHCSGRRRLRCTPCLSLFYACCSGCRRPLCTFRGIGLRLPGRLPVAPVHLCFSPCYYSVMEMAWRAARLVWPPVAFLPLLDHFPSFCGIARGSRNGMYLFLGTTRLRSTYQRGEEKETSRESFHGRDRPPL
jgi:hypothetical protein